MTAFDRFDPFERRISDAIDEIAAARPPEYLDDILRQTARKAQRPRWTFLERWLPMDTALSRPARFGRLPLRQLIVLALLVALMAAALAFYIGSQKKLPPPLGPAANGQIAYGINGDLYVRDSLTGASRLLLGGPTDQGGVVSSPDGRLIAYDNVANGVDHAWLANADGSNPRQFLDEPFTGLTAQWSYDSKSMVFVTAKPEFGDTDYDTLKLWVAPADGSGARQIILPGLYPIEAIWDPVRPGVLLVRTQEPSMKDIDMYYVDVNAGGAILSKIDMPAGPQLYGSLWEFRGMAFSPDGQTIAYNSLEREATATGEHFWVRLMDRDGTNDRQVALPAGIPALYSQAWSVFSPDGKWIAMESWVTQPDGSSVNQLAVAATNGASPTRFVGPKITGHSLVKIWSPDGTRVLVHVDSVDDMYLIDPVTGDAELLPWKSDFPDWQRVAK